VLELTDIGSKASQVPQFEAKIALERWGLLPKLVRIDEPRSRVNSTTQRWSAARDHMIQRVRGERALEIGGKRSNRGCSEGEIVQLYPQRECYILEYAKAENHV
jgi:hypothetical protein